ncbi:MAG TPA: hypothetical protein PLV13_09290 [Ilumatobacteraceae bacterium]|nr:hypothetical protein [Ilumatobacteraceae bacterium]
MIHLPAEALDCFRTHHGMATAPMLTVAGISRRSRNRAVEEGLFEVWYERVFRICSTPLTLEARCAALCLAHPRGFITGPTAGKLRGLRRMPRLQDDIHFAHPHGAHIGPYPGVRLRQSTKIPPAHRVHRADGIIIASDARLAFDLAASLGPLDHCSVVEQLLREGRVTMATLGRMGSEMAHPARPGSVRFVATLLGRSGRPADSHPEVRVAAALRALGVPVVAQYGDLQLPNGRKIHLDLAVPSIRWGIEIDVHPEHLLLEGTTRDKRRDRQCHRIGWQVERVSELDLLDVDGLCDELAALYHARCLLVA